jgi:hypothetical protein
MIASWLLAFAVSSAVGLLLRQLLPPMADSDEDPDGW